MPRIVCVAKHLRIEALFVLGLKRKISAWVNGRLSGPVFNAETIVRMTIPFILDSMSIYVIWTITTALISTNGETSVAAVSLVMPILNLVTFVFNGIGAGGSVIVAQSCGTKNPSLIKRSISQVIWPTIVIGLAACFPAMAAAGPILSALYPTAEAQVLEKAIVYFKGCLLSEIPFTVYTAIFSVLRGTGESKKCLALSVIINVAYLLFCILFLNVMNLDIRGSYLALQASRVVGTLAAIPLLFWIKPIVRLGLRDLFVVDRPLLARMFKVSIPLSLEQMFSSFGNVIAEIYMAMLGTASLAANAVANSLLNLLVSPAMAAASLAVTVVGRCIGAGQKGEARRYARACVSIGTILMAAMAVLFYPLLPLLLRLYHPTAQSAVLATRLLWFSLPVLLLFWPCSNTMPSSLRAANDTIFPSVFPLIVMWVINILAGYVLAIPLKLGLMGVWIATWSAWIVRAVGFEFRFRRLNWREADADKAPAALSK